MKNEICLTYHSKVMANVKILLKKCDPRYLTLNLSENFDLGTKEKALPKSITYEI